MSSVYASGHGWIMMPGVFSFDFTSSHGSSLQYTLVYYKSSYLKCFVKGSYLRGSSLERATSRSRLTTGASSRCCSQSTGGDAGGEIRKVLSFLGGSKNARVFFSFMGFDFSFLKKHLISYQAIKIHIHAYLNCIF